MSIKLTGFDKLQREFEDARRALGALDGTISTLKFDPTDYQSVEKAIRQMESAIDSKVARYRGNALVSQLVPKMKEQYRKKILEIANKHS
jgi:hypothetical protein